MLTLPLMLLTGGLALFGIVLGARWLETRTWHNSLQVFSLRLPSSLGVDQVAAWLGTINASTHANKWLLLPPPPLALEIVGTSRGIAHYLLVPERMRGAALANLRAALPGVRLEEVPDYLANRPRFRVAAEAGMTHARRPLAVDRAATASAALLASLQPLYGDEIICAQWIIAGGGIAPIVHSAQKQNAHAGTNAPVWTDSDISEDAETVRAAREKHRYPLLHAVVRVGIRAESKKRAYSLFGNTWGTLRGINAPGVGIVRRWYLPVGLVADRMQQLSVPTLRFPLTLNVREASGLVGLGVAEVRLPGLSVGSARQLPPPQGMASTGTVIARSNYPGTSRPLALTTMDRLQHSWVVGPTGSGKSTLLGNLMVQDMQAGSGLVLIDARGDLVTDVLARVPAHRRNDVIVIDPSETARPIGFNVLNIGHGEHARELAVDHILHVLQDLYRSSWGPRTADILRASLLTLTATKARDGSAFTLAELPELLGNATFRQSVISQPGVTGALASFWYWYASLSEAERATVVAPALNKLRVFTLRTPLRLLLGQSQGFDLSDVFTKRRILLVPLSRGTLGPETAALVGSLLVASIWQVTLGRVRIPTERRRPVWLYADEFQETVRLPLDLADMLAQARGLGLGLTLAHQHLGQLPDALRTAVSGTARTHILFQLGYDDARAMAHSFAPLTPDDLMGLERYEIAVKPSIQGRMASPVTGITLPLPEPVTDGATLAQAARERYGLPRADVETALRERIQTNPAAGRYGRTPRGGQI